MLVTRRFTATASTLMLAALVSGCFADTAGETASSEQDIINGTFATAYPEAVHVNMADEQGFSGRCSGTVIAPRVVLTAGHCVDGYRAWGIHAPFAGDQGTLSTHAETLDWDTGLDFDIDAFDVAVVLLDEDIVLDHYPRLATAGVDDNSEAIMVGRTIDGVISPGWLFESAPIRLFAQIPSGSLEHPNYYYAEKMAQKGDSGGPVFAVDETWEPGMPRTVIGIVATRHLATRVELVREWVTGFVDPPE